MKGPLPADSAAGSRLFGAVVVSLVSLVTIDFLGVRVLNLRIRGNALPEYATWTGIPTLEHKLRLLRDFKNQGPVDAIIIGSSIPDHGISAAVLSQRLSASYGRQFRVFNLSTGGA